MQSKTESESSSPTKIKTVVNPHVPPLNARITASNEKSDKKTKTEKAARQDMPEVEKLIAGVTVKMGAVEDTMNLFTNKFENLAIRTNQELHAHATVMTAMHKEFEAMVLELKEAREENAVKDRNMRVERSSLLTTGLSEYNFGGCSRYQRSSYHHLTVYLCTFSQVLQEKSHRPREAIHIQRAEPRRKHSSKPL